jgi:hypothetical protein
MISAQSTKVVQVVPPGAIVDDTSFVASVLDTIGFAYATLLVLLGGTDIAMAALKVQESDEADDNFTDVTGLVFGTSKNIAGSTSTLPSADNDNDVFVFDVNLLGRKRYLKLVATAGNGSTGTYLACLAILSRAAESPVTAAERGAEQILRV